MVVRYEVPIFVLVFTTACGDVDNVQVPLIPEPRRSSSLPYFESLPTAAVQLDAAGGESCAALRFDVPQAPESPESMLAEERVVNGAGNAVRCNVRKRSEPPRTFDVHLSLTHAAVRHFGISGPMREGLDTVVALEVTTADATRFVGDCAARDVRANVDSVSFMLQDCVGMFSNPAIADCKVSGRGVFEHCTQ